MKKIFIMSAACMLLLACNDEKKDDAKTTETTVSDDNADKKMQPSEFADPKYMEMGKKMIAQMASGDMAGWMSGYADNAVYQWSAGDSLGGKAAIEKYWTSRRKDVIDSISFTNDIWLPLKVNTPQRGPDQAGIWLLSWYQVHVKYKNGQKLSFWTHTDHHFDANDKVDRTIQYIDRAPINKALGVK